MITFFIAVVAALIVAFAVTAGVIAVIWKKVDTLSRVKIGNAMGYGFAGALPGWIAGIATYISIFYYW